MPLPPEVDDAISPRSPLRPPRKSFAFALRTAVSPPGRCIGTREYSNVKPLRFRDTALAALLRYLLQLRCCTPLPLCNTLFQRLSLLSDTSLVQSAFRQRLLAPFSTASRRYTIIAFFPTWRCTRIIRLAAERIGRGDAHSLHYLAAFVGGTSLRSVTATLRGGRRLGARECGESLRYRCSCLYHNTLFQRLALLPDTDLCPNVAS